MRTASISWRRGLPSLEASDLPLGRWVLTPHPAEAGRLLDCSTADIQQDRVSAALRLAQRYQAVVVLKGCGTVVADAGGPLRHLSAGQSRAWLPPAAATFCPA